MTQPFGPKAWKADEVASVSSWIQYLSAEEIAGFDTALAHALKVGKPLLEMTREDFPLPPVSLAALERAFAATLDRWGMRLVKGFPVDRWTEAEARLAFWGMGLHVGIGRTQNRASQIMNDVRDEGGSYKVKGGRGYNTNAGLDFHMDSCDIVGLLCRRTARSGGTSKVVSSIAIRDEIARRRPDLLALLQENIWYHSYQGQQDPSLPPVYRCPIIGNDPVHFAARANRKNTTAAQVDFPETPRLTPQQVEALDLLDELMASDEFCYSMTLDQGDMQLLNSYVTLHSRTPFEDFTEADNKRHLFRLWLCVPASQPLPPEWEEYYGDVRAGSVRGGVRGSAITPEFLDYERRQAVALGMKLKTPITTSYQERTSATT
ncbi:MAG: TauD/TfdA family dioxygenase [Burkholderiaceae bacterium]